MFNASIDKYVHICYNILVRLRDTKEYFKRLYKQKTCNDDLTVKSYFIITSPKVVIKVFTDFGYIGKADGILYATEAEALEANADN